MITIHQRHRRTDGRHAIPRPRICTKVHCAVKITADYGHVYHDEVETNLSIVLLTIFVFHIVLLYVRWTKSRVGDETIPLLDRWGPVRLIVRPLRGTEPRLLFDFQCGDFSFLVHLVVQRPDARSAQWRIIFLHLTPTFRQIITL